MEPNGRQHRTEVRPQDEDAPTDHGDCTDLARYVQARDGDAFARLVQRLGPVVYGVCRRRAVDADEVFQATFLVLAQEADVVLRRWGGAVGAWLYGTAYRLCQRQRRSAARRVRREQLSIRPVSATDPADEAARRELLSRLDDEIHALPRRLQRPLVLCDIVGLSHAEAAAELGISPRTLARQLAGARTGLHRRLSRSGVVVTAGVLTVLLADSAKAMTPTALTATAAGLGAGLMQAPGLSAASAMLAAADRAARTWSYWLTVTTVVAGALLIATGIWWAWPTPPSPTPPTNVVGVTPTPPKPATGLVVARGQIVDAAGRPAVGVEVLLLTRPVRRFADGRWKPLDHDPLAVHSMRDGMFRELGSIVTDAEGRYEITGELIVPDPVTKARWFQTLPHVEGPGLRVVPGHSEFRNLIHQHP